MRAYLAICVVALAVAAVLAFPSPTKTEEKSESANKKRQADASTGYMALGNNKVGAGGGVVGASPGDDKWKDPSYWEKNHETMWGGFENYNEKWQNWAQDSNSGNYRLANQKFGAFDNGEFNVEKASEEFFGPDHVKNDDRFGNYTTNAGFGIGGAVNTAPTSKDKGFDGKGGFWARLHCRIHSSLFLGKKHLRLPIPCSLII